MCTAPRLGLAYASERGQSQATMSTGMPAISSRRLARLSRSKTSSETPVSRRQYGSICARAAASVLPYQRYR